MINATKNISFCSQSGFGICGINNCLPLPAAAFKRNSFLEKLNLHIQTKGEKE